MAAIMSHGRQRLLYAADTVTGQTGRGGTSAGNRWYSRLSTAVGRAQYFSFAIILIILSYAVYYYYRNCDRRRANRGPNLHRRPGCRGYRLLSSPRP